MGGSSSDSGGGGGQNPQAIAQRMASRRVQKTGEAKGAFVTSGKGKNKSIVRSSSGSGVIAGQRGARIIEEARQAEVDRLYKTPEAKNQAAIRQLEKRLADTSSLNIIGKANLENQIKQLQSGKASPEFTFSTSGNIVTTGVRTGTSDGGTTNIAPIIPRTGDGADVTPEVTPEITGVIAPDDTSTLQTALLTGSKTRRTKYKRFGGASDEAGKGVLVRKTTA